MVVNLLFQSGKAVKRATFFVWLPLFLLVFLSTGAVAQVSGYTLQQLASPGYAVMTTPKTNAFAFTNGTNQDNARTSVAMPFGFNFNGQVYNSVNISLNGFLTFGALPELNDITPLSGNAPYDGAISGYGWDLDLFPVNTVSDDVFYKTEGTAPNRIFKVEWIVKRSNNAGTAFQSENVRLQFQVWLYETTNVVEIHYNSFNSTVTAVSTGEVGLRGANNLDYIATNHNLGANWPVPPGVAANTNTFCQPTITPTTAKMRLRGATLGATLIVATSARLYRYSPPACFAPRAQVSCVTADQASLSWSTPSPAPASGYDYFVTTSTTLPTGATTPSGTIAAGATSATITGLTASSTYYAYVRSKCGTDSCWLFAGTFATRCASTVTPYAMFSDPLSDSFTVPALPACTSIQQANTASNAVNWVTQGASTGDGFFDEHLVYNGNSSTGNVWFFTRGISLTAGTVYRLSYLYGGSTEFAFLTNKMQVAYGLAPCAGSMTTQLIDHNSIKASPIESVVNFTCSTTGVYYFGFRAYSDPNNGKLFLDDIQVVSPGCARVLSATSFNVTSSTASLTWPVPSPAPASGYAYFLSTSAATPAYGQTASGTTTAGNNSVTITGLTPNTTYYFWVRTVCGFGDQGEWSPVHSFTTSVAPPASYCTPAPTSVDNLGIVNVTVGTINNSTGAEPGNYGNYSSQITNVPQGQPVTVAITFNTGTFNYNTKIWIDFNNDSDFADAGENVYTGISGSSSPNTLNATFTIPLAAPLGEHRMRIGGADINDLTGFGVGQGPCYNGTWGSFEDYTVNVTVPPPALTISRSSDTLCALTTTSLLTLTSAIGNFNTYTWSPAIGVTGDAVNGWTFNNSTSITYTLTAVQTGFPFASNTVQYRYNANPLPTPITLTPNTVNACPGVGTQITATGGVVGGLSILEENFNGAAPGWTFTTGGSPAPHGGGNAGAALWQLQPNGYTGAGGTFSSNDATQFVASNSDAQGSGTQTNTVMISPVFSLASYTSASLRFFHYYRPWSDITGFARVSISTDGGTTYTQILNWGPSSTTATQGSPNNFAQVIFNLDPYVGQTNLRIRFDYFVSWGWIWAIDNFLVSGSASSAVTWSPVTGLFTNAALTTPYVAGTGTSTVYAAPNETTTYTASASTPAPTICSTSATATITVPVLTIGTAGTDQNNCSGVADNIVLTGSAGTVVRWEASTDAAFTTPIIIPSSASTTLTSAQIGTITANRWFRARISVGGCTVYSNVVAITFVSTTWNGTAWSNGAPSPSRALVFAGNFSSTANVQGCSCTIQSGNVVFNTGHTLRLQNGLNRVGGTLTFENDASLVQVNDDAINNGYIVYKRNTTPVRRFDFTFWSSPLFPQTLVGLSPLTLADKYYRFDTALNSYVNVSSNSLMNPGQGYVIRAPQSFSASVPAVFNGVFNGGANDGVPNNGVITMPIVLSGANNFNLLGNPYPSAIDADLFYSANSSLIDGNFYFWTHNTPVSNNQYSGSDYAVWNSTGQVGTAGGGTGNTTIPNGNIAAGQGFFVKSISNGTAVFNNAMRLIGNNNAFFRMAGPIAAPIEKHRIWLNLTNSQGAFKQTLLGYVAGATNAKDYRFDGDHIEAGNVISFYSVVNENKLGIQGRALPFNPADVVPLGYRSSIAGPFQIALSAVDGLFTNRSVYLEDTVANVIHDLKSGPYSFSTEIGTFDNRFIIRYIGGTQARQDELLNPDTVVLFKDNQNSIQIATTGFNMEIVQIYDLGGRLLYQANNLSSNVHTISNLVAAQQMLVVKIVSDTGKQVAKKLLY